jgi:hypothetical protein
VSATTYVVYSVDEEGVVALMGVTPDLDRACERCQGRVGRQNTLRWEQLVSSWHSSPVDGVAFVVEQVREF